MWCYPPLVYPVIFFFLADRPERVMLSHDRMDCPSLLFGIAIYQVDFSFEAGNFFLFLAPLVRKRVIFFREGFEAA